jgi:prevent-host-death family protein
MTKTVNITEARAHLSELIDDIENGASEIIICRRGTPVARLTKSPRRAKPKPWPSPEEMARLLDGADTIEEMKARLKTAGLHHPLLEVAGMFKDDPTWDEYQRRLRRVRKGR